MRDPNDPRPRPPIPAQPSLDPDTAGQTSQRHPPNLDRLTPPDAAGHRFDRWLHAAQRDADALTAPSRAWLAELIATGAVRLDGHIVKPSHRLKGGEHVTGSLLEPAAATTLEAQPIPLAIVYQDDDLLVINKPAGLVVHPAPGHADGTLVNAILGHWTDSLDAVDDGAEPPDPTPPAHSPTPTDAAIRPGIVHRLDRDTSGLIVVARHRAAQAHLQQQMAARTALKQYLLVVIGHPTAESGTIEAPIGRDPRDRQRMAITPTGRPAVTHFRVVERLPTYHGRRYSLIEATLETGRTHQIRVHFAAIGHPVLGDPVYGVVEPKLKLARQFLHAHHLAFDHPATGARLDFTIELPDDLRQTLNWLRGNQLEPK